MGTQEAGVDMSEELLRLVDHIHLDKEIDKELIFIGIEQAIESGARKLFEKEGEEDIKVMIDREDGEISATLNGEPFDIKSQLGRIQAQTTKQVIIQKIREAERDVVFTNFVGKVGELVSGTIQRVERGTVIVNLGRTDGIIPRDQQIRTEAYRNGDRVRCVIKDVEGLRVVVTYEQPDQRCDATYVMYTGDDKIFLRLDYQALNDNPGTWKTNKHYNQARILMVKNLTFYPPGSNVIGLIKSGEKVHHAFSGVRKTGIKTLSCDGGTKTRALKWISAVSMEGKFQTGLFIDAKAQSPKLHFMASKDKRVRGPVFHCGINGKIQKNKTVTLYMILFASKKVDPLYAEDIGRAYRVQGTLKGKVVPVDGQPNTWTWTNPGQARATPVHLAFKRKQKPEKITVGPSKEKAKTPLHWHFSRGRVSLLAKACTPCFIYLED